jgi:hypothetical protein
MARTRKTVTTTIHGANGRGATLAEAKRDAAQRIQTAFADEYAYTPQMQRFPQGEVGLLWRALDGWHYDILWSDDAHKACYGHGPFDTRQKAQRFLRRHIAQQYTDHEPSDYGMRLLDDDDTIGARDHAFYMRWQHTCQAALAQGMTDTDAHAYACEHTTHAA